MRLFRYTITFFLILALLPSLLFAKETTENKLKTTSKTGKTHTTKKSSTLTKSSKATLSYNQADATNAINTILARFGEDINIGIMVKNLKTNQIVYAKNADSYYVPASNQKILTAYTALSLLGSNFTYQTKLFADVTKISNNTLNDNVTLKFSGDPELTFTHLDTLLKSLSKGGVHTIKGKFIIDDGDFDNNYWPPGGAYDDHTACFGAPISTVIINRNCVGFQLYATRANQPANVSGAATQLVNINNQVTTETSNKTCVPQLQSQADNNYILSGCVRRGAHMSVGIVVQNPHLYAQSVLRYLLKKNQITVSDGVSFGSINPQTPLFVVHKSRPLGALVTRMLKRSDNIIANALFKTIGFAYNHSQSTWENSGQAMQAILSKDVGIQFADHAFIDGAGLSRYNHITPAQITAILQRAYQQYAVIPEAVTGLPIAGVDGTLAGRMSQVARKVRAKTGSEISVCSLSGYIFTRNNQVLSFSILINGFVGPLHKYRLLEDKICIVLTNT
ncbi:D-alanyl-D-alanine carboxypeptidase/D-alanyl-D-alanine-endopeptidase [soil metagenome]